MQEVFEKIVGKLEEEKKSGTKHYEDGKYIYTSPDYDHETLNKAIEIVKQAAAEHNNGWIPCSERLPDNAEHKGSICPRYYVMTIYGQTVGWFNPDYDSWFVLIWFMTARYLESEIDMERGDIPKIVRAPLEYGIVKAWKPLPEPYQTKGE